MVVQTETKDSPTKAVTEPSSCDDDAAESKSASAATTTATSKPSAAAPKCDVCGYGDGHNTLRLIRCTTCGVHVHRDCYGMPTYVKKTFKCWACRAVGKTFRAQTPDGTRLEITQETRPTRCDLCGFPPSEPAPVACVPVPAGKKTAAGRRVIEESDSEDEPELDITTQGQKAEDSAPAATLHAMHPLYDNYGSKARQLAVLKGGVFGEDDQSNDGASSSDHRLVWAHTLCGFFLTTKNLLFMTSREGTTHEGDEEDPDDDRSVNPDLEEESDFAEDNGDEDENENENENQPNPGQDLFGGFAPSHHFVWPRQKDWIRGIRNHQRALVCQICRKRDDTHLARDGRRKGGNAKKSTCFRVAVQCTANDSDEYEPFRQTHHKSLAPNEVCTMAFHVGCARWGGSSAASPTMRNVFYFPGLPHDDSLEPIRCLYCDQHATDVNTKQRQERDAEEQATQQAARAKRKRAMELKERQKHPTKRKKKILKRVYTNTANTLEDSEDDQETKDNDKAKKTTQILDGIPLVDQIKKDLGEKVISVTRDDSKVFIKEQKSLWQGLCRAKDIEDDAFKQAWKAAKSHANKIWKESNTK